jgi:hypothetical protein
MVREHLEKTGEVGGQTDYIRMYFRAVGCDFAK